MLRSTVAPLTMTPLATSESTIRVLLWMNFAGRPLSTWV